MKKITYMLAGVLLVALVLPVHAEKKKEKKDEVSNPAMLSVCQWAAGRNISANEGVISTCAELGVKLGSKPAGVPSIMTAAELKAAFETARDNAQEAWEKWMEAKAAQKKLKQMLNIDKNTLLGETAKQVDEACAKESVCPAGGKLYDVAKHLTDAEGLKAAMDELFKKKYKEKLADVAQLRADGKDKEADKLEAKINEDWSKSGEYQKYTNAIAQNQSEALAAANKVGGTENGQAYYDAISAAVSNSSAVSYYAEVVAVQTNPDPYKKEAEANYAAAKDAYHEAEKEAYEAAKEAGAEYTSPRDEQSAQSK